MPPSRCSFDAVIKMSGGLGNQLFQYALGTQLAIAHGRRVAYDISFYSEPQTIAHNALKLADYGFELPIAELHPLCLNSAKRFKFLPPRLQRTIFGLSYIKCPATRFQEPAIPSGLTYYTGLWQSPRYFAAVQNEVRSTFREKLAEAAGSRPSIRKGVVGFHVRRGDYLAHAQSYNLDYQQYLQSALTSVRSATGIADWHVSVYSDDPDWCEANLRSDNLEINRSGGQLDDLLGLASCEHKIISNSTFAWWAAFIGHRPGTLVMAPTHWHADASNEEARILCDDWHAIGDEARIEAGATHAAS